MAKKKPPELINKEQLLRQKIKERRLAPSSAEAKKIAKERNQVRMEARELRAQWKWKVKCSAGRKVAPLVINEFEGSTKVAEWNKLLEKKCSKKFDKGIKHDAMMALEGRLLWKMSEVAAKKGNRPRITPEMVLQASRAVSVQVHFVQSIFASSVIFEQFVIQFTILINILATQLFLILRCLSAPALTLDARG